MYSPDDLDRLAGADFNRILQNDPVLAELECRKNDRPMDSHVLIETMGIGSFHIGRLPVKPMTPTKWAFLWLLESPFVVTGKAGITDLDILLYILSCPDLRTMDAALTDIPAAASGYAAATAQPIAETTHDAQTFVRAALYPLTWLPAQGETGSSAEPAYDALWVTRIAGIAARESGHDYMFCLHDMSLSACCAFYANWRAREDSIPLKRHNSKETEAAIQQRIATLTEEFLKG